ncbi:MAG TPA: PatB family C-S lyase [Rhodocyclaceae bacterium]
MTAADNDFDIPPRRDYLRSMRWQKYAGRDVIPLWVADMDFAAPPPVIAAVRAVADDPVYGYAATPDGTAEAVAAYCAQHYGWAVDPSTLLWLPGLVSGLHVAVRTVAGAGGVLVMPPIYPPFLSAPGLQGAQAVTVPLLVDAAGYRFDIDGIDAALRRDPKTRLLMLCHPHNPVGRAWRRDELAALAALAEQHDLVVCSDEVHCDLLLEPGARHIPFATLPGMAERTITLMAPSKTYNVAGLGAAWAVVGDPALRTRVRTAMNGIVPYIDAFGFAALNACVGGACEDWRQGLLAYLRQNRDRVAAFAGTAGLAMPLPEASFLAWFDTRHIPDAHRRIEAAGVGLSNGADFGAPGFLRLNFGTQRRLLDEALSRMVGVLG